MARPSPVGFEGPTATIRLHPPAKIGFVPTNMVPWIPLLTLPFCALAIGCLLQVLLRPARAADGAHWTERARIFHPVRAAGGTLTLVLPAIVALLLSTFAHPEPHWILITFLGGLLV